jgi:hypothetical protein
MIRRAALVLWMGLLAALAGLLVSADASASASDQGGVAVSGRINGQSIADSSPDHPIHLSPKSPASMDLSIANDGDDAVTVARVELSGRVAGLTFYSFDTSVDLSVAPGSTERLSYSLVMSGLRGQATGLIGGSLEIYDTDGHSLAAQSLVSDVSGSIVSVYGLFGVALVLLTVLALADCALAIAFHRMPANRWRRALRTVTPGIGIGLVLVFSLSALRVWVPAPSKWALLAGAFAAAFFIAGYLTPNPAADDNDDDDEGANLDGIAARAPDPSAPATAATEPVFASHMMGRQLSGSFRPATPPPQQAESRDPGSQ